jgi:hypothetical protein
LQSERGLAHVANVFPVGFVNFNQVIRDRNDINNELIIANAPSMGNLTIVNNGTVMRGQGKAVDSEYVGLVINLAEHKYLAFATPATSTRMRIMSSEVTPVGTFTVKVS